MDGGVGVEAVRETCGDPQGLDDVRFAVQRRSDALRAIVLIVNDMQFDIVGELIVKHLILIL